MRARPGASLALFFFCFGGHCSLGVFSLNGVAFSLCLFFFAGDRCLFRNFFGRGESWGTADSLDAIEECEFETFGPIWEGTTRGGLRMARLARRRSRRSISPD